MFVLQLLTNKSKSDVIQKLQPAIQLDKTIGYYEVSYGLYGQAFGPFCEDKQYVKPFSVAISSQTHNGEGQKPLVQYFLKSETGVSFFDFDQQFSTRLGCNVGGFPAIRSSVPYELKVGDYFWLGAEEALLLEKFFSGEEQNWRILIGQDEYLLTAARVFGSDTDGIPIRKWNGKTFLVDQTDPHCKYVPLFCFDTDYAFHHIRMNANEWRSTSSSIWLFPTNTFNTPFTPLVKEGESLDFGFGGSVSLDKKPGMIDRLSLLQTHLDLGTFGLDADGFSVIAERNLRASARR